MKQNLKDHWWHRLAVVSFVIILIIVGIISALIGYVAGDGQELNRRNTTVEYVFNDFIPNDWDLLNRESKQLAYETAVENFLSHKDDSNNVGCWHSENIIRYASSSSLQLGLISNCSKDDDRKYVIYSTRPFFYIYTYLMISVYTVLGVGIVGGILFALYRYGFLYIVLGPKGVDKK